MKKLRKFFLWSLVFLLLLTGFDQLLLRTPMDAPVLREIQTFYQDFRGRLFALAGAPSEPTIDTLIEQADQPVAAPASQRATTSPRYFYADENGALQFVESLDEVPTKFRYTAQELKK